MKIDVSGGEVKIRSDDEKYRRVFSRVPSLTGGYYTLLELLTSLLDDPDKVVFIYWLISACADIMYYEQTTKEEV